VFVGGAEGVAEQCAARLRHDHPGLSTPVVTHGYVSDEESDAIRARIAKVGRAVVLVGMGSPRQETWARRHLDGIPGITVVTVGGLFDFFSGRIPRAPAVWRELGVEWLYRLIQEPRRLARRYLLGNPLFLALALRQRAFAPELVHAAPARPSALKA
jgi:N-acetylglucosaminyldiphosphoundecaprenol N-acetyl-beta-D-mannosaminyltransferase